MSTPKFENHLERIEKLFLSKKNAFTVDEASIYTGLAKSYLYKLTSLRLIPFSKPNGKVIYFSKEKLESWMLENEHPTKDSIEREAFLSIKNGVDNER